MIWESSYWKDDLLKIAAKLKARTKQKQFSERSLANIEKEVFFAFYATRKLIEAKKLSDSVTNLHVAVDSYSWKGKPVTHFNWNRKLGILYDFKKKKSASLTLRLVCNQIIHSYIFTECFNSNGTLNGIMFCSDRERTKQLYCLDLSTIVRLLKKVGSDYPSKGTFTFDPKIGDYAIHNF